MEDDLNYKSIEEYEKISEDEAKKIFAELCELNDNQNTIDLNFIRRLLSINNNNYSPLFLKAPSSDRFVTKCLRTISLSLLSLTKSVKVSLSTFIL